MRIEYRNHWLEVVRLQADAVGWTAVASCGPAHSTATFIVGTPGAYDTELEAFVAVVQAAKRRIAGLFAGAGGARPVSPLRHGYARKLQAVSASETAPRAKPVLVSEPLVDVFPGFAACPQAVRYVVGLRGA